MHGFSPFPLESFTHLVVSSFRSGAFRYPLGQTKHKALIRVSIVHICTKMKIYSNSSSPLEVCCSPFSASPDTQSAACGSYAPQVCRSLVTSGPPVCGEPLLPVGHRRIMELKSPKMSHPSLDIQYKSCTDIEFLHSGASLVPAPSGSALLAPDSGLSVDWSAPGQRSETGRTWTPRPAV